MNNRETYLLELSKKNGSCECPELSDLHNRRKSAEKLEALCDFYKRNVDLENPTDADRDILTDYRESVEAMNKEVGIYHSIVTQNLKSGSLTMHLHNPDKREDIRNITYQEARKLLNSDKILSIHCAKCQQQVDIA